MDDVAGPYGYPPMYPIVSMLGAVVLCITGLAVTCLIRRGCLVRNRPFLSAILVVAAILLSTQLAWLSTPQGAQYREHQLPATCVGTASAAPAPPTPALHDGIVGAGSAASQAARSPVHTQSLLAAAPSPPAGVTALASAANDTRSFCATWASRGRGNEEPHLEEFGVWKAPPPIPFAPNEPVRTLTFEPTPGTGLCWAARPDHNHTLACLRGQHIVFVCDSTVRYQYISLVHWLHTGAWVRDMDYTEPHNPLSELSWPDWRTFLIASCNHFAPYERCDVFRHWDTKAHPEWMNSSYENRYYRHPQYNISVSLFVVMRGTRGHLPIGYRPGPPLSRATFIHSPPDYEGGFSDLARVLKRELGTVDALFVNQGHWPFKPGIPYTSEDAQAELRGFGHLVTGGRRPVWMTTTPIMDMQLRAPEWAVGMAELGWAILDRHAIVSSVYRAGQALRRKRAIAHVDRFHLKSFVNTAFNEAVLGMLCPLPQAPPPPE